MNNNCLLDKMFKPEFRFLIDQEDGEILPLIDSHLFTTLVMVVGLNIILIIGLLTALKVGRVGLHLLFKALTQIWGLLTPGNEIQDLFLIGSSIFLGSMLILIMNELLKKLDDSFTKLNIQLKEKDARIIELETNLSLVLKRDELGQDPVENDEVIIKPPYINKLRTGRFRYKKNSGLSRHRVEKHGFNYVLDDDEPEK